MSENAAEACATKCNPAGQTLISVDEARDVKTKQEYDACYSKCVAQETKEVVEEREKVILRRCCSKPSTQSLCCKALGYFEEKKIFGLINSKLPWQG